MAFSLSAESLAKLKGVHPDLVKVVKRAIEITHVDFKVLEGLRTVERQKKLVAQGASKTMNSRHITGHAVDLAPYLDTDGDADKEISWHWPHFWPLVTAMETAASDLGVSIVAGARWTKFKDGPHFELNRSKYP